MSSQQNNQNQAIFTVQSLDLNFSKKKRNKTNSQLTPCTDRKYSIAVLQPQPIKTQRSVLIEKKKNYSQAIRERNQILLVKKRHETSSSKFVGNEENQQNKGLFQIKQNMNIESAQLRNVSRLQNRSQKSNAKIRSGKKACLVNVSSLDFDAIPHRLDSTLPCFQHSLFQNSALFSPRQRDIRQQLLNSPKFQAFEKQKSPQRQKQTSKITKLKICSNEVSEKVIVLDSDATLLAKQNATFKKDLANFRKQNSVLRKELQDAKNHISELEQRAKNLLQDSLLKTPKLSLQIPDIPEPQNQPVQIINSQQIIQKLRTQIAELKNINSSLQLRTYMAEKKVTQQVTSIKKKMAKQLHDWRDKCTKLRAQNMKYKKIRDMTISMEISKDQQ